MSDDIVKRLRGIWRDPASIPRIELDAADEIERLREENRKLRAALSQQYATVSSLLRSDQMPSET